jgi:hypothetical protein
MGFILIFLKQIAADSNISNLTAAIVAPVAQLDRASVYGTEGCVFDSRQAYWGRTYKAGKSIYIFIHILTIN